MSTKIDDGIDVNVKGKWFTLLEDEVVYVRVDDGDLRQLTIVEGFVTDFASIPPWLHWLIPKFGKQNMAAVAHDYLYDTPRVGSTVLTQKQVDEIFLQVMTDYGVSWWRRRAMYRGVRIGGWWTWRKYRKKDG